MDPDEAKGLTTAWIRSVSNQMNIMIVTVQRCLNTTIYPIEHNACPVLVNMTDHLLLLTLRKTTPKQLLVLWDTSVRGQASCDKRLINH